MIRLPGAEGKRGPIFEAALRVFARKGYHGATVDDVASEAKVAKGTIYNYFKSKSDLFTQLYNEVEVPLWAGLERIKAEIPEPLDRIRMCFRFWCDTFAAFGEDAKVMVDIWANSCCQPGEHDEVRRCYLASCQRVLREVRRDFEALRLAGRLRAGGSPEVLARAVSALFDGLLLQCIVEGALDQLPKLGPASLEIILAGAAP